MRDLLLDTTGDLAIVNGDLVIASGSACLVQHLRMRLRLFAGEWFLDTRLGVPYYEQILIKNPDLGLIETILKGAILDTQGVLSLKAFSLSHNTAARALSVSFTVDTDGGELTITGEELTL